MHGDLRTHSRHGLPSGCRQRAGISGGTVVVQFWQALLDASTTPSRNTVTYSSAPVSAASFISPQWATVDNACRSLINVTAQCLNYQGHVCPCNRHTGHTVLSTSGALLARSSKNDPAGATQNLHARNADNEPPTPHSVHDDNNGDTPYYIIALVLYPVHSSPSVLRQYMPSVIANSK